MAYSKVPETSIFLCSSLVKKAQKVTHENYINNLVTEESSHKFFLEMRKCVFLPIGLSRKEEKTGLSFSRAFHS